MKIQLFAQKIIKIPERFLLACSGVSLHVINHPESQCEAYKGMYMRLGGIILLTSTFAALSCSYAVFIVLQTSSIKMISIEPQKEEAILNLQNESDRQKKQIYNQKIQAENLGNSSQEISNLLQKDTKEMQLDKFDKKSKSTQASSDFLLNIFASCFIGLLWGVFIFLIDSFIVATTKKNLDFLESKTFMQKLPEYFVTCGRIILAGIIGYTIAIPVEILIFSQDIREKITIEDKEKKITQNISEDKDETENGDKSDEKRCFSKSKKLIPKTQFESIKLNMIEAERKYEGCTQLYQRFNAQVPSAKESVILEKSIKMNEAKLELIQAKIALERCSSEQVSCWTPNPSLKRLSDTIDALEDKILPWVIRLIFIFIDVFPVLAKISKSPDNYDLAVADNYLKRKKDKIFENKTYKIREEFAGKLNTEKIEEDIKTMYTQITDAIKTDRIVNEDISKAAKPIVKKYIISLYNQYFKS